MRMRPDLASRSRAVERTGNPSPQFSIEPQLDNEASSFVVGLRPHACPEAPFPGLNAFDSREAASMEVRKMLPIDRVLVQPLDTHRQLAPVGRSMRHNTLATDVLAHAFILAKMAAGRSRVSRVKRPKSKIVGSLWALWRA